MNGKTIVLRNDLIVDVDLTLLNGAIRVDQDKKIKVISGTGNVPTTLTFNNEKISNACDKMWSEIESNDPLCLLKVLNGTSISQAKSAINFSNGAALYIDASTLTNNYRNIVLSSFYGLYPFNLTDSKISGSYYGMLPPHSTDFLPYSGVEINNVNEVTVGNSLLPSYLNEFKKLRYGIVANASNVNVYNNKFNEIKVNTPFFNLINNSISIAIWTRDGFSTSTSQFINVGNTGVNQKNYFTDCWKGVQVEGSMSTLIKGNEFKNNTGTAHT